tara:strand:+ start:76 stop:708 length:633 start_codon:yes stop_codon:yes gene_type:complete
MRISWISDSGLRIETSQGLILYNHTSDTLTKEGQKDDNTIAIFQNEESKNISKGSVSNTTDIIFEPGEYEINGVPIQGQAIKLNTENLDERTIIYSIISENLCICLVQDINQITIPASVSEAIGKVDILSVICNPSSENTVESINSLVSSLDPQVLIPIETNSKGDSSEIYQKLVKELGHQAEESVGKANITKSGLQETLKILNLKKSSL